MSIFLNSGLLSEYGFSKDVLLSCAPLLDVRWDVLEVKLLFFCVSFFFSPLSSFKQITGLFVIFWLSGVLLLFVSRHKARAAQSQRPSLPFVKV